MPGLKRPAAAAELSSTMRKPASSLRRQMDANDQKVADMVKKGDFPLPLDPAKLEEREEDDQGQTYDQMLQLLDLDFEDLHRVLQGEKQGGEASRPSSPNNFSYLHREFGDCLFVSAHRFETNCVGSL